MNDLFRELAPVPESAWEQIDDLARQTLQPFLAARRVVDFVGPLGWDHAAVNLGRVESLADPPTEGVTASRRRVQPLIEVRTDFELSRRELEAAARGALDAELDPVRDAARRAAFAEDLAVFHGYPAGGVTGIAEGSGHDRIRIADDYELYPKLVGEALAVLRTAGVAGPYALVLGPRCHAGLIETVNRAGFPIYEDVVRLIEGPVLWAPAVDGAVVASLRGGDFELTCGRDFSIGYADHDASTVRLYLVESFAFRLLDPDAAVHLTYG